MTIATRSLTEITQEALHVLYNELGMVDTVRFLNQFTAGYGNYTEERRELLKDLTLREALDEVYAYQAQHPQDE
jgi:hypothetical protein